MDSPSSPGTGALIAGVTTVFLTIIAFGVIRPPAAVKPDDKAKLEGVTAPPSQQPADAVNPGSGKMPESKPKP